MIMGQTLIDIFKGSIVMILLLFCSIAALALIIERLWYFMKNRFDARRSLMRLRQVLGNSGPAEALNWAKTVRNPVGRLFALALENLSLSGEELSDLLFSSVLDEKIRYERLLGGIGTIANAATLLGLLGTVTGLIEAFHNIAVTGSGGPVVVSSGIAEALLTTAFGLFIGIPSLVFYNYFAKKAADSATTLEGTSDRLVVMLERFKKHSGTDFTAKPPRAPQPQATTTEAAAWNF